MKGSKPMTSDENLAKKVFASLVLVGENLDPEEVSAVLRLDPYKHFKRGDIRSDTEVWKHGYWEICSVGSVDSTDLALHIEWIANQLLPATRELRRLMSSRELKGRLSCFWILDSTQTALGFSPVLLRSLSDLGVNLELDIFCDT